MLTPQTSHRPATAAVPMPQPKATRPSPESPATRSDNVCQQARFHLKQKTCQPVATYTMQEELPRSRGASPSTI